MIPAEPYRDNMEHILAELKRLDLLIRRAVLIARQSHSSDTLDEFRGLVISDENVNRLLSEVDFLGDFWKLDAELRKYIGRLDDELERRQAEIHARMAASAREDVRLGLAHLASIFDLSPAEVDVLLIALAPEVEPRYETLFAYLQNDVTRKRPSLDLCLNLICRSVHEKIQARQLFSPDAALFAFRLLELREESYDRRPTHLRHFLKMDDTVARYLLEHQPEGTASGRLIVPGSGIEDLQSSAATRQELGTLADVLKRNGITQAVLQFWGPNDAPLLEAAEAFAYAIGKTVLYTDLSKLDVDPGNLEALIRDASLWDNLLVVNRGRPDGEGKAGRTAGAEEKILAQAAKSNLALVMLSSDEQFGIVSGPMQLWRLQIDGPDYENRHRAWREALNGMLPDSAIDRLADLFSFSGSRVEQAVGLARARATLRDSSNPTIALPDVLAAGRDLTAPNIQRFATPIEPKNGWDDLVLPPEEMKQLRAVAGRLQNRNTVHRTWEFGAKMSRGRGLGVLFTGSTGSGKTMAAEVLALELSLRLFQIDLASVVSKYIGETESHLDLIFREAELSQSLLFFDEADALFGKRTEISDAHDHYANIEVNYLLQRIEQYQGVVVLATNFQENIDEAFLRRLHCVVKFPFPDELAREQIWRRQFPAKAPVGKDVDFAFLAKQFKLSGGNIRNAALEAAFLAAEEAGSKTAGTKALHAEACITMDHVIEAIRHEYQKQGKLVMKTDLGRYWRAS